MKYERTNINLILEKFKIRKIEMKTRILYSFLLTVIFLVAFSGCSINKKTGAVSGIKIRQVVATDSNYTGNMDEQIPVDNINYNASGKSSLYSEYDNPDNTPGEMNADNSNSGDVEVNYVYPNANVDANLDTFESSLASDGNFINISQDEIDPENNVSGETAGFDDDIYTNTIWIPNSNDIDEDWTPYTNGRWVWSDYGWSWTSNYRWGWATYHYGRWWHSERYGWVWSPGRRWAPAWVMWSHHKDYEGWYPVSPRVHIQNNGVVSNVMHHYQQNGWVIVKKNDFTKTINNTITLSNNKKSDVIKNSNISITLNQNGNKLYNKGNEIIKNENLQVSGNNKKSVVQVTTNQKPNNNKITPVQLSNNTLNNSKKVNNAVVTKSNVTANRNNITATSTSNRKQENIVNINKSNTFENKKVVNNTQEKKKVTVTSTTNGNKNNTIANKQVVIDNQKKIKNTVTTTPFTKQNNTVNSSRSYTTEKKPVVNENQKNTTQPVDKNRNSYITKTNSTFSNTKTENTVKTIDRNVNSGKNENLNKTVNTAPKKTEQNPKVNMGLVFNSQQKNLNNKDNK